MQDEAAKISDEQEARFENRTAAGCNEREAVVRKWGRLRTIREAVLGNEAAADPSLFEIGRERCGKDQERVLV
jgi:hypothetical protein